MDIKENRDMETNELTGYTIDYSTHKRSTIDLEDAEVLDWIAEGNTPELAYTEAERQAYLDNKAIEEWKDSRTEAVTNIKVTVDGMVFDGDEKSQTRMTRAITALEPLSSTLWTLSDNSNVMVTREQFKQALKLAGEAQTALWTNA